MSADTARTDQRSFYDQRYARGYMEGFTDFYEACRARTVDETLGALGIRPARCLDYGCGSGRYMDLVRAHFPEAHVTGSDVSAKGLELGRERHPDCDFVLMDDEAVPVPDGQFDLVVSIEVLEHVADVAKACTEIGRVLAPGGRCLITTPCANPWSLEWALNRRRGGLQPSHDGYGRFATDEPGHLRRLRSADLERLMADAGVSVERVRFRAHLFTALMASPRVRRRIPQRVRVPVAMLDWRLFRRLPNAATMVFVGRKAPA